MTTRTIRQQSECFKPEIINQAWNNPTADIPTNKSGFKFNSPEAKSNFATASLYYIDGIAYADKFTAKIEGKTQYSNKEFQDKLRDFQQTTKAKAGFSWGGFSIGGESSFTTSEISSDRTDSANVENGGFTINHDPIGKAQALKNSDGEEITGDPKSLIGISLKKIGLAPGVLEAGGQSGRASARSERGRVVCTEERSFAKADPTSKSTKQSPFRLVGKVTFFGDDKKRREYIIGDDYSQTIYGLDGKENINAGGGDDIIYPGSGISHVKGGSGADLIMFRRDSYTNGGRNFTFVKDWKLSDNDRLAFNGYLRDQVFIAESPIDPRTNRVNLYLQGTAVASFKNITLEDMRQIIDNAYFSTTPVIAPTPFLKHIIKKSLV